jgi:hypothetical protein
MTELIVYNTPFQCANECAGCYWKRTQDTGNLAIKKGMSLLNEELNADKKATLIIAIMNNPRAYEHTAYVLKSTKHLRRYRETHLLVNIKGARSGLITDIMNEFDIAELTLSVDLPEIPFARAMFHSISSNMKARKKFKRTVIIVLDQQDPTSLKEALTPKKGDPQIDTIEVLPLIDKHEVRTAHRSRRFMSVLEDIIVNTDIPVHMSSCISCFGQGTCPAIDHGYTEISGAEVIRGCPYKMYDQCKTKDPLDSTG